MGTLLNDPAICRFLSLLTNKPGQFAQVAEPAAAVADTPAAPNNDDSVSDTSVVEVIAVTSKPTNKVLKKTGVAVAVKQESKLAGNDSSKLDADKSVLVRCRPTQDSSRNLTVEMVGKRWFTDFLETHQVEDRGLSELDIETKIGGRSKVISKLVDFMKDTVYKTRIPSVTKRRTGLQHFMRMGVQLWSLTIEEQCEVLSQQEHVKCYTASESDYEWNDPEKPFIEADDSDKNEDEDEEQVEYEEEA
ncbi:hypothetical protein SEMRO_1004_G230170.1 [Seminavis robusta]|uniref:Uncharacterized protein n=1 Tax=Seminavis robusta TaxID=568900 RepID=A0A9N8HNP7_9STRA|nr:hypothetical protein SEMRO_1004_G230170.1 [Seminavis robusta]|eukprot:Sro1004_g230170.1 n/a (247) ;mRNA; f:37900-38640